MAKITKSGLKSLIKECLIEILAEGLGESVDNHLNEVRQPVRRRQKAPSRQKSRRPALDSISFNQQIDKTAAVLTENPVMASIFKDTAATTLQEQLQVDSQKTSHLAQVAVNGDAAAKTIAASDPNDVFGDASNNWATLAFS